MGLSTRALGAPTWDDFAALVERAGGVWGGCWCMGFHPEARTAEHRGLKEARVRTGRAHAALVYDDERCVGWAQFGSCEELPRIKHRRQYEATLDALPDWRITCFFVDKEARRHGVSSAALGGALEQIGALGGGLVEGYPEALEGQRRSAAFLYSSTASVFERHGFERVRPLGLHHWVMRRRVDAV